MIFNVHAGHNPDGKTACGAVGLVKESTEAREIAGKLCRRLKTGGHTVYDCTVDNGVSQSDVLKKIVSKCNAHKADLDVSLHLNAGAGNSAGNGKTEGVEVYIYNSSSKAKPYAEAVLKEIAALGFTNRGVKERTTLSVLKNTKAPAMLVECFFVDDKDDVELYQRLGGEDAIAAAIARGIISVAGTGGTAASPVSQNPSAPAPAPAPGVNVYSKTDFIREVQELTGARVDGIAGPETLSKTITVSKTKNRNHLVVWAIQKYLNALGYNCGEPDGIAGVKFDSAVKTYQREHGCVADGELTAGKGTWKSLLGL